ncbi:hypothetical protein N7532_007946 [Penicillium argentinense]|uniref:Ubiquitin-like domain-containing protein n=1 Tax=Penicillium argentinense TaxID=1131581 RepID=A0A9W9EWF3_9EURO|nr:uncharacterized protein N7532_007946 [Penicillium argentinense]KAJ5089262.1 hypothetical protein N7532_007946 [Penicillium argentinense]
MSDPVEDGNAMSGPTLQECSNESTTITLKALCSTLPPPGLFVFKDQPLSETVGQFKTRLAEALPNRVEPADLRLVFSGKILNKDNVALAEALSSLPGDTKTVHLVMPLVTTSKLISSPQNVSAPLNSSHASTGVAPVGQTTHRTRSSRQVPVQRHFENSWRVPDQQDHSRRPFSVALSEAMNWNSLVRQVAEMEDRANHSSIPPTEILDETRRRIRSMLHERRAQSHGRPFRDTSDPFGPLPTVEQAQALMDRVHVLQGRVQQMRIQNQSASDPSEAARPNGSNAAPQIYLITSPGGQQSLILPRGITINTSQNGVLPEPRIGDTHPGVAELNQAIRQGLIEHQNRQNQNRQQEQQPERRPGAFLRQIWLFIRLYFFIHMLSDSGTWTRIFLVTLALMAAFVAPPGFPLRLRQAIIDPLMHHFHAIAQNFGAGDQAAQVHQDGGGAPVHQGLPGQIMQVFRRVERFLMLFLFSLVPGLGEGQVEIRTRADRARQEEQERENQQENEQGYEQDNQQDNQQENEQDIRQGAQQETHQETQH